MAKDIEKATDGAGQQGQTRQGEQEDEDEAQRQQRSGPLDAVLGLMAILVAFGEQILIIVLDSMDSGAFACVFSSLVFVGGGISYLWQEIWPQPAPPPLPPPPPFASLLPPAEVLASEDWAWEWEWSQLAPNELGKEHPVVYLLLIFGFAVGCGLMLLFWPWPKRELADGLAWLRRDPKEDPIFIEHLTRLSSKELHRTMCYCIQRIGTLDLNLRVHAKPSAATPAVPSVIEGLHVPVPASRRPLTLSTTTSSRGDGYEQLNDETANVTWDARLLDSESLEAAKREEELRRELSLAQEAHETQKLGAHSLDPTLGGRNLEEVNRELAEVQLECKLRGRLDALRARACVARDRVEELKIKMALNRLEQGVAELTGRMGQSVTSRSQRAITPKRMSSFRTPATTPSNTDSSPKSAEAQRMELRAQFNELRDALPRLRAAMRDMRLSAESLAMTRKWRAEKAQLVRARDALRDALRSAQRRGSLTSSKQKSGTSFVPVDQFLAKSPTMESLVPVEMVKKNLSCCAQLALVWSKLKTVLSHTTSGLLGVSLYFADVSADVTIASELYRTENDVWAGICVFLIIFQYVIVYFRVNQALQKMYPDRLLWWLCSCKAATAFLWLGFPVGVLLLDFLMLLQPFGLLTLLGDRGYMPNELRVFLPAYTATRLIVESLFESCLQICLQSYIFVAVVKRVHANVATKQDLNLYEFAGMLPRSILISTLVMLKTWSLVVLEARKSGMTVAYKGYLLWEVGGGLPLDALVKSTIDTYTCERPLTAEEVIPFLDALSKNESLKSLDLGRSDIIWESGGSGAVLLDMIVDDVEMLPELEVLTIHYEGFPMPIRELRALGAAIRTGTSENDSAEAALTTRLLDEPGLFKPGGPRFIELLFMADLVRKPSFRIGQNSLTSGSSQAEGSPSWHEHTLHLLEKAFSTAERAQVSNGSLRKEWEQSVVRAVLKGEASSASLHALLATRVLRQVGIPAKALTQMEEYVSPIALARDGGYTAVELREASYTATELRKEYTAEQLHRIRTDPSGRMVSRLEAKELFNAGDLSDAGFSVTSLRAAGFSAANLGEVGSFSAKTLKEAGFTLEELLGGGGFSRSEVGVAGFGIDVLVRHGYTLKELRELGVSAREMLDGGGVTLHALKKQGGFTASEMKYAGISASELLNTGLFRSAAFSPAELRAGGYSAGDLLRTGLGVKQLRKQVGYSAAQLKADGVSARELKESGCSALELAEAGFALDVIESLGFSSNELYIASFQANQSPPLKEQGSKKGHHRTRAEYLRDLKATGLSSMAEVNALAASTAAAHTAKGTGTTFFTASELREATFTATELNRVALHELHAGAGISRERLEAVGALGLFKGLTEGVPIEQLLEKPFSDKEQKMLRRVGFSVLQLRQGGFTAATLKAEGFPLERMRAAHFSASELKAAGFTARELRAVGFTARRLKDDGLFVLPELLGAGFTQEEIDKAGFNSGAAMVYAMRWRRRLLAIRKRLNDEVKG